MLVRGGDERGKQRMRLRRLRLELGMELHGEEPRVAGQFGDLDELAVRRAARDLQAAFGERSLVEAIELVAVTMPLVDQAGPVDFLRERSWRVPVRSSMTPPCGSGSIATSSTMP